MASPSLKPDPSVPVGSISRDGQEPPHQQFFADDEQEQPTNDGTIAQVATSEISSEDNQLRAPETTTTKETTSALATRQPPLRSPAASVPITVTPSNHCSQRKLLAVGLMLLIVVALVAVVTITVNVSSNTSGVGVPILITLAPSTPPSSSPSVSLRPSFSPSMSFKAYMVELIQSRSPQTTFSSNATASALDWIVQDPYSLDLDGNDDRLVQRFALATIWFVFGLESSSDRAYEEWMQPTHECLWRGRALSPTPACSIGRFVTGLVMGSNSGSAYIPTEILLLSHLEYVGLAAQSLTGTIPSQLSLLTSLTSLRVGAGALKGTIPSELWSSLTNLETLQMGSNPGMSPSSFPPEVSSLSKLTSLVFNGVRMSGSIPSELGSLMDLRFLMLSFNRGLTGSIPTNVGMLTRLSSLTVGGAEMTGPLPTEIGLLTSLNILSLGPNPFTSTIPTEFGLLTQLSWLSVYSSDVNGTMPTELAQLDELVTLELGGNQLTGTIPSELALLTQLTHLGLERSRLVGTIPSEFTLLSDLKVLDLYGNNELDGTLMTEIGLLLQLSDLLLGLNDLSGRLPTELGLLTSLSSLSLDNNRFSGSLPSELGSLTELRLSLEANDLTGTVPNSTCATAFEVSVELEKVECSCCECC